LSTMEIVKIKGVPVIDIYESFEGSYWFITEKCHKQNSVIRGKIYENDQILFGYVKLASCPECAEFGYISETELDLLSPRVWKVPKKNWSVCPEVKVEYPDQGAPSKKGGESVSSPIDFRFQPLYYVLKANENQPKIEKLSDKKLRQIAHFIEKQIHQKAARISPQKVFGGQERILKLQLSAFQRMPSELIARYITEEEHREFDILRGAYG